MKKESIHTHNKVSDIPQKKWTINDDKKNLDLDYIEIAKTACDLIEKDDTIYLNSGTSGNLMAEYLPHDFSYSVVTNSVCIANALSHFDQPSVFVLGGKMRIRGVCDDMYTLKQLKCMKFDKSFITGYGITCEFGLSNTSINTATLHETIISQSKINILLLPSNRIGREGFIKVTDINKINILITNKNANYLAINALKNTGIKILLV